MTVKFIQNELDKLINMKKTTKLPSISLMFIVGLLAACGGGGGSTSISIAPSIGYVVDSPVEGLAYTCGALTGTTGSDGSFLHDSGAACTFKIGNVTIGSFNSAPTDGVVTPHDLAGVSRGDSLNASAVAIAQFLQSLDDGSASGKIKIPNSVVTALSSVPAQRIVDGTTTLTQNTLSNLVSTATANNKTLVSAATAGAAMNTYIQTTYPNLDVSKGVAGSSSSKNNLSTTTPSITTKTSSANVLISSNKNGVLYWVLVPSTAQSPTASNIIESTDSSGVAVGISGNKTVAAGTVSTISLSGLEYGTSYKYYAVVTNLSDSTEKSSVLSGDLVVNYPASPNIVVSGLTSNLQLTLQNNAGNDLAITNDGTYTFSDLTSNLEIYSITISSQPFPQYCSVKNSSGTVSRANTTDVLVTCKNQYVYAVNSTSTGGVSIYKIGTNGSLADTNQSVSTGNTPVDIIFDPTNSYAYVPNGMESSISQFKVNADGSLSAMNPATVSSDIYPLFASTDVGGKKFFEISGGGAFTQSHPYININQYTIGSDGKLAVITTPAYDVSLESIQHQPQGLFFEPTGKYAYALYGDSIRQFSVSSDGTISPLSVASTPIGTGVTAGTEISGNLTGTAIYVVGYDGAIYQFSITSNGLLSALTPASVSTLSGFTQVFLYSPDKKYAYISSAGSINQYSINSNGALQPLSPSSVSGGTGIVGGAIDRTGKYLYVTYSGGARIKSFAIGLDGKLTLVETISTNTPSANSNFPSGIKIR
jgi:6-phosphogluconolactonase